MVLFARGMFMKRIIPLLIIFISLFTISFAHSGRTDSSGGHYNRSTGEYHYHHGYSAHQHYNGICPYEDNNNDTTSELLIVNDNGENEEISNLENQIYAKETTIGRLNTELKDKNKEIEELKNEQTTWNYIYWFVIICMGISIWRLKKDK